MQMDKVSRENIVYVYLKADSTSSESLQTETQKSLRSQSSDLTFPVRNSPTCRPETCWTSYRAECHRQIPVHLVLTPKKQKATRTSDQLRSTWWASNMKTNISPWRFWPNPSSHSLIFYLYYFSNTFCKCNMKSTITRKIDMSLWSLL